MYEFGFLLALLVLAVIVAFPIYVLHRLAALDLDGDSVVFGAANLPAGATFDDPSVGDVARAVAGDSRSSTPNDRHARARRKSSSSVQGWGSVWMCSSRSEYQ